MNIPGWRPRTSELWQYIRQDFFLPFGAATALEAVSSAQAFGVDLAVVSAVGLDGQ